ncbi:hypothetical protein A2U01_0104676, partial [Trifolium medium]|nr:hypothetical protein [Trifolium medium]
VNPMNSVLRAAWPALGAAGRGKTCPPSCTGRKAVPFWAARRPRTENF